MPRAHPSRTPAEEVAPPALAVPLAFFLTASLAVVAAGVLLALLGTAALRNRWAPDSLGTTHLATLGFIAMSIVGMAHALSPRVLGARASSPGLAYAVHALLTAGGGALVAGLLAGSRRLVFASIATLAPALLLFLAPLGRALLRATSHEVPLAGLRLAAGSLFVAGLLGLWMAHGHAGMRFPGTRGLWVQVHVTVALLGFAGGWIVAISSLLLPARPVAEGWVRASLRLAAAGVLLPLASLALDFAALGSGWLAPGRLAAVAALPAALGVWIVHPLAALRALGSPSAVTSRRLWFWWAGLGAGPCAALAALGALLSDDPRLALLLGWVAIWGWAGMIVHGLVVEVTLLSVNGPGGGPGAPPDGARLPAGFGLHLVSVLLGAAAIVTTGELLARLAGLAVAATGSSLTVLLLRIVARRRSGTPAL